MGLGREMGDDGSEAALGGARLTRREILHRGAAAGAVLGVGPLLAACGGSSSSSATTTTTGPQKRGGTLRVGLPQGGPADTIDGVKGLVIPDFARLNNLYDTVVTLDPHTHDIKLLLAEEFTPNATGTEWTIRLRDGIEFHNGKTLGADDLIFTMQHALDPKTASPNAANLGFVDPHSFKKLDARTLRVGMTRPFLFPFAFYQGLFVMPAGWDQKHPVGTGPFKFVSFTPGKQSVFTANENYWQGRPFVDELQLIDLTDDTARLNAQLGGQTDLLVSVPYASTQTIKSNSSQTLVVTPNDGFVPFAMNCATGPCADARVRQALRLIADRNQIINAAFSGFARLGNDLYAPNDPLFDHSLEQRKQDLEQAKSLLKQAGHLDTTFTFNAVPLVAGCVESAQVFAQNAKSAGVNMQVKQIDIGTFTTGFSKWQPLVSSQWPYNPWITQVIVADGPKAAYAETHFGDVDKPFAALFKQVIGEVDDTKRKQIAGEMQQIQWDRGGYLLWGFQTLVDAASTKVKGYITNDPVGWDFSSFAFRHVSFA